MSFPRKPYVLRVEKVTNGSGDVASATLKFENVTKGIYKEITGTAANSNGSYDLGDIGDWSNGDSIKVTATKGAETGYETHTVVEATDHGRRNFGIISIAGVAATGVQTASHTPSSAADTGTAGQVNYDTNYIYVCIATNTWKRAGITTW